MNEDSINTETQTRQSEEKPLSVKELKVCDKILLGMPAYKAYQSIYKNKTDESARACSSDFLTKPNVNRYMTIKKFELEKRLTEETFITKKKWLEELEVVGFSRITDYLDFGINGAEMKSSDSIDPIKIAAIESIESNSTALTTDDGSPEIIKTQIKFKLHKKLEALQQIGQALGFLKGNEIPNNQIQVNINVIGGQSPAGGQNAFEISGH